MRCLKNKSPKLKLSNTGKLTIFFSGTGSAFAKTLSQNNIIIIKGNTHLAVDMGNKTPQTLYQYGLPVFQLQNFLITHSHADHIGGLEEVMMFARYVTGRKPNLYITKEYKDILWNQSLRGGAGHSEYKNGHELRLADFWNIKHPQRLKKFFRHTWEFNLEGINIKIMRTKHIPDNVSSWRESMWSCGVIINNRVFFTSDTRYDPELILEYDKFFNFEIIFHDCQFFTGGVHASLEEIKDLPAAVKKKTLLMHYGDNFQQYNSKIKKYGFKGFALQNHKYIFS